MTIDDSQTYKSNPILIMNDGPINHEFNVNLLLNLSVDCLSLNKRVRDSLMEHNILRIIDFAVLLVGNRNSKLAQMFYFTSRVKQRLKGMRVFFHNLIKVNGSIQIKKSELPNVYPHFYHVLNLSGFATYFFNGGKIPAKYRKKIIWIKPWKQVIDAMYSEIEIVDEPIQQVYRLLTMINDHLGIPMKKDEESIPRAITKYLNVLSKYQNQVGGLQFWDHTREQFKLKLFWVFKLNNKYHKGNTIAREESLNRIKQILSLLIFPSKKFTHDIYAKTN